MLKALAKLLLAAVVVLVAIGTVFLVGMRRRSPAVLTAVRRINRTVFNPKQMKTAGTPGAFASVIHHRGRNSGTPYETPIGAVSTDDGFVIALPYGSHSDWVKNVMAAGEATLVHEGRTYRVDQPEIVPLEAAASDFSEQDQTAHRVFGVRQCLRLRQVAEEPADHGAVG